MKAALAVLEVVRDPDANLREILTTTHRAADADADLVLFGEGMLTGLVNRDDPDHDLPLGRPVPGPEAETIGRAAAEGGLFVGLGLLEREGHRLYDTALLCGPGGDILLHYRRIHPGWHGPRADARVYRQGLVLPQVDTPLGRFAFLICGDLFDDEIARDAHGLAADWILFPFWRCFEDDTRDDVRWQMEEAEAYAERVAKIGTKTLMVNVLAPADMEGGAFGGAFVLDANGQTMERLPLGAAGMLLVDLPHGS